jgi:hypothetical protein
MFNIKLIHFPVNELKLKSSKSQTNDIKMRDIRTIPAANLQLFSDDQPTLATPYDRMLIR